MNLGNGSIKLNNKNYAINWTGQYAQHITENYNKNKSGHTLLHVEIQQALARSNYFYKDGQNSYKAIYETFNGIIIVVFHKTTNFVNIVTGYINNTTMEKATKNKKKIISGTKQIFYIQKEDIDAMLSDGLIVNTRQEAEDLLIRLFTYMYKKKGYKNFELEFV